MLGAFPLKRGYLGLAFHVFQTPIAGFRDHNIPYKDELLKIFKLILILFMSVVFFGAVFILHKKQNFKKFSNVL
jgi:hypothetical protein